MKWLQGGGEGEYSQKKTVASSPGLKYTIKKKTCKAIKKNLGWDLEFIGSFVRKVKKYAPNLG